MPHESTNVTALDVVYGILIAILIMKILIVLFGVQ